MLKLLAKFIMWLSGWTINPNIPKEYKRSVTIAAPHTSNWDFIYTRLAFYVLDVPVKIAIKDTWTKNPLGFLIKALGGLGIDRSPKDKNPKRKSQIEQMSDFFSKHENIALVIAPEGTRRLRKQWKLGFYHTAKMANVPITYGYLNYEKKEAGIGGPLYPTDDVEADLQKVMAFYQQHAAKFPDKFCLDERYSKTLKS